MDLVHPAGLGREGLDQRGRDELGVAVGRLVREARPRLRDREVTEAVVRDALAADGVRHHVLALGPQTLGERQRGLDGVGRVAARQTAVRRDQQDCGTRGVRVLAGERVLGGGPGGHCRHRPGELIGVRGGGGHRALRLTDARRGDHLHRLGDLLRRGDRADPALVDPKLCSHGSLRPFPRYRTQACSESSLPSAVW